MIIKINSIQIHEEVFTFINRKNLYIFIEYYKICFIIKIVKLPRKFTKFTRYINKAEKRLCDLI